MRVTAKLSLRSLVIFEAGSPCIAQTFLMLLTSSSDVSFSPWDMTMNRPMAPFFFQGA